MGTDEGTGRLENPEEPVTPERKPAQPPVDDPGSPGQPSRLESYKISAEPGRGPSTESRANDKTAAGGATDTPDPKQARDTGPKPAATDTQSSPLDRMESNAGFANLTEEFDARAKSRLPPSDQTTSGQPATSTTDSVTLENESIRSRIDPHGPTAEQTEARKEPFQQATKNDNTEWTDGVAKFSDLPSGEKLSEGDEDKRSKFDSFRKTTEENIGTLTDQTEKGTSSLDKIFGPRPTGHAETKTSTEPVAVDAHHAGIDVGTAASSLLAIGIVGADAARRAITKIQEWRNKDVEDHR